MTLRLLLALLGVAAFASAEPLVSVEDLAQRLHVLEQTAVREAKRLEEAKARWAKELQDAAARRRELAGKILGLQLDRQNSADIAERLGEERERVAADAKELIDLRRSVSDRSGQVAEQLDLYLSELPGGEGSDLPLAEQVDLVHHAGTIVSVRDATLRTASGTKETVTLLCVGHVAFAYRTGDGRLGLAVASPADAAGYRWTEALDARRHEALGAAMDAVRRGDASIDVPLDVSGRIQRDSSLDEGGLLGLWKAGGPVMYPLASVALLAFFLIVERAFFLLRQKRKSSHLLARVVSACREKRFKDAERICTKTGGVVGRTLATCLRRREGGPTAMEDGISEQLLHEMPRLQRFLGGIATLGAVAPLLGLLGTVTGIIQTFGVIKTNANPGLMAGGISEALLTTASGLVIAIPILLIHSLLSGRTEAILSDAEKSAATLYNALQEMESPSRELQEMESCSS